jgi:hypothetical protein
MKASVPPGCRYVQLDLNPISEVCFLILELESGWVLHSAAGQFGALCVDGRQRRVRLATPLQLSSPGSYMLLPSPCSGVRVQHAIFNLTPTSNPSYPHYCLQCVETSQLHRAADGSSHLSRTARRRFETKKFDDAMPCNGPLWSAARPHPL